MNVVLLRGRLSSEPRSLDLPSGDVLLRWEVTTEVDTRKLTVPVAWFEPPRSAQTIGEGDEVVVLGRIRRRFFQARGATVSETEVLAHAATLATRTKNVAKLVDQALAQLPDAA